VSRRRIAAIAALVLLAALFAATARWIVWPDTDGPGEADAIVALAGAPERLPAALELMREGKAPLLLVSLGSGPGNKERYDVCGGEHDFEVVCFVPDPDRTQGEAEEATRIAEERGLKSLLVVTSRYHAVRAGITFRRCFDGEVRVDGVRPDTPGGLPGLGNLIHEWGAYVYAFTLARSC
jgi:uncharacterized SAM-binding protein YcdF (DUF218 family)